MCTRKEPEKWRRESCPEGLRMRRKRSVSTSCAAATAIAVPACHVIVNVILHGLQISVGQNLHGKHELGA